jgi:hypothetical protein
LAFPSANWPAGVGITTSSANIAESPVITSVLALAAEKARSAPSSSSTAADGEDAGGWEATNVTSHAKTRADTTVAVWRVLAMPLNLPRCRESID